MHYYQPLWTLVGGGQKTMAQSMRDMGSLIPAGADWIRDAAASFKPESNTVVTQKGQEVCLCIDSVLELLPYFVATNDTIPIPIPIESNRSFVSQHTYDFLVVAVGMQLQMDKIKGLKEALKTDSRSCL